MVTKWKTIIKHFFFILSSIILAFCISFFYETASKSDLVDALRGKDYIQTNLHKAEVENAFESILSAAKKTNDIKKSSTRTNAMDELLGTPDFYYYFEENDLWSIWNTPSSDDDLTTADDFSSYSCRYDWKNGILHKGSNTNNELTMNSNLSYSQTSAVSVAYPRNVLEGRQENWNTFCIITQVLAILFLLSSLCVILMLCLKIAVLISSFQTEDASKLPTYHRILPSDLCCLLVLAGIFLLTALYPSRTALIDILMDNTLLYKAIRNNIILTILILGLLMLGYNAILGSIIDLHGKCFYQNSAFRRIRQYFSANQDTIRKNIRCILSFFARPFLGEKKYPEGILATEKSRRTNLFLGYLSLLLLFWMAKAMHLFPGSDTVYILVFLMILAILMTGIYIHGSIKLARQYRHLEEAIIQIHNGNYQTERFASEKTPFAKDLMLLSDIGYGFDKSLKEQIKAEQMKIQLVTNVSHDLKTPLTSIISYIDLLSREPDLSDEAREYVDILIKKSDRLKRIVSDVFELAKTSSGEIQIDAVQIDFKKLLIQTVSDMDDRIKNSGLEVKLSLPEEGIPVITDGNRMYRVLQNLLDNALKYSLMSTRIYMIMTREEDTVRLVIKNTANYEMNFTEEDVLERFFCGDSSRNQEGNGLGLSIAQGFTIACGGTFHVHLDGDQFNVIISFPIAS